ncbi:FAD-binding oxidoreductase [Angelakisella massiliensis]|uniref:FAD-binding oxidoreductase n=1 Tax=Angelakisella massiliensis TaxID=1871018 RepID=UPI0008F88BFD|nr:FAD-binding oxidoreductase [Angelakisella massiliensis]
MDRLMTPFDAACHESYLRDESCLRGEAAWIALPSSPEEVSEILAQAREKKTSVTVRGGGTGITGGAVPMGGIVMSTARLTQAPSLSMDEKGSLLVTAGAAVTLEQLQEAIARRRFDCCDQAALDRLKEGWIFAVDPTETTATLGGMFASNAGGLTAMAHGRMADYVERVGLVLADGSYQEFSRGQYRWGEEIPFLKLKEAPILCPDRKFSQLSPAPGDDLIDVLAGSEGMLGIVTQLTVRLSPAPADCWGICLFCGDEQTACSLMEELIAACEETSVTLEAVEYFSQESLALIEAQRARLPALSALPQLPEGFPVALYCQLTAPSTEELEEGLMAIMECADRFAIPEENVWAASEPRELKLFHALRHAVPEAVNMKVGTVQTSFPNARKVAADFCFRDKKPEEILALCRRALEEYALEGVIFGHLAAGMPHINFICQDQDQLDRALSAIVFLADAVAPGEGMLFNENGLGKTRSPMLKKIASDQQLRLMEQVKLAFDPQRLLNPRNME